MNYSDAERIETILKKYKLKKSASLEEADFVIFVTCGVRQSAEDRVYGQINNIRKKYPKKFIILTGCLAHRKDVQRRLKEKADLFVTIKVFPKEIEKILNTKYQILNIKTLPCNNYLQITPKYSNNYTAYVPIMTGCNNFCSYCVVPYARGREYSRPAEDILEEIKGLVQKGYKEIILLGQNVNSYRSKIQNTRYKIPDTKKKTISFADLLESIDAIRGKFWLSFLTSHPKDMSDELIETIVKSKNICEYISLPAQSGDNEILRKMNRRYTVAHYKNLIKKIRQTYQIRKLNFRKFPKVELSDTAPAVSTDIIVGFPGETKKQFENTVKLFREMKFDMAYISQYSPRSETAAWKLKNNISKKEKVRREKILTNILARTALVNNKKYIGRVVEVLVDKKLSESLALRNSKSLALGREKPSFNPKSLALENDSKMYKYLSHTRTQKKVILFSNKKITNGNFQIVKITKAKAFGLEGTTI
ncbi:MAG: hypothetical protein A2359_02925 [Candidatus Moranbacteria bacterium RIFOXYB1_FULL_43_19]|nr:MAG: hypothetical protein A2359_02925 [Candidatus Moranbacteria bacterium RIFOXYB1_FULL_43_19]OGI33631.1 MAG: hypothetical protein A2420_02185 [Candidatus Moranbacteria bacterium RIFOXYC1_FULL_44_13]